MHLDDYRISGSREGRTLLPGQDAALAWSAIEVAELAGWLLASCDARLLCLALDTTDPDAEVLVIPWRGDRALNARAAPALVASQCAYPPILNAITRTARTLLGSLGDRWPPYARPPRLGVVTDGTGVAFSPNEPWPLAPEWLFRHFGHGDGLRHILPFAANGNWAALVPPRVTA